ncbi:hypothetical protein DB30_07865 [Enhygromyxa salina]|uniref:Uncharacterized protein n=1 Tax=Enhygromyxa salina TaxID=215803 RepID=A0A0C2D0I5_9BACT|nr:hypothetical protein [Enhygromyxa salina]KIG13657.1 hypothetical protein DB30_07865 [Enhygromyxa salina]
MTRAALHPGIAALLESRRLGSLADSRHRFTVSREEALLQLRKQASERDDGPWDWTLLLVRAANAMSEIPEARVELGEGADEQLRVTTIDVITPGTSFDGLDLTDILAGALEPDLGEPVGGGDPHLRVGRFRMLIGRAINAALAREPIALELETPVGGRRFERREQLSEGRDPYIERKLGPCVGSSRFVVRVTEPRPGLSSRLGRWLRRRGEVTQELATLWRSQRLADRDVDNLGEDGALSLGPALQRAPVMFGEHALYGPARAVASDEGGGREWGSLFLVRDGLLLVDLGPALREQQVDVGSLVGWIDCPKLRLTADERSVVRDANFELLVAWLHDYQGRSDGLGQVSWPTGLSDGLTCASGRPVSLAQLTEDARRGRELIYVWRHQAGEVPAHARAQVVALAPSQELLLRERFPELRLVPLRALGGQGDVDPADLTSLQAGSYEALALIKDSPINTGEDQGALMVDLRVSVDAYVHRAATATTGFIVILAYERRVAQIHEHAKVIPGVTLICRVRGEGSELDVAKLRRDHAAIGKIADLCRVRVRAHWEALLVHAMSRAKPWENPLLRSALDGLGPRAIDLRYQTTEDGLRLGWRDTVLLDVELGRALIRSNQLGPAKTLRDALRQLRERGFVLVAHPHKRYDRLISDDPRLYPWLLHDDAARALLVRVVGAATVLDMPVVAEAHPLVVAHPLEDQRHLLRGRETIERDLQRSPTDPLARQRLLGHLLVARGLGLDAQGPDAQGLETVPLLDRYDPRALSPTRLVSLASVLSECPRPGLVPAGAVHRELPRPMLEVGPGLADLLAQVEDLEPGSTARTSGESVVTIDDPRGERSTTTAIRRRARGVPPLLASSVVHAFVIGRLQVAGDASSDGIGLWASGLRVGELELPEPLGRVSGRLLLTPQGQRVGQARIREEVTAQARTLLADALRQRTLLPPDGPQRRRLDHFVEYIRGAVQVEDRFGLAEELGLTEPEDRGKRVAALRAMSLSAAPLRPLSGRREGTLAEVVRLSLAMRVHFDTAMLSWRAAKLGKRRRDGSLEIEFGLRNAWIQRGLDADGDLPDVEHRRAALLAGVFIIAEFFAQAGERDDVELGPEHLVVALWRLLKLS